MSPPNSSNTTSTTLGCAGLAAPASSPSEQPHRATPAIAISAIARTGRNLASGEEAAAESPREPLAAPAHDHVVVVREHRPRDRGEQVHPRLRRPHVPLVGHGRHAVLLEEPPVPLPGERARGLAAH